MKAETKAIVSIVLLLCVCDAFLWYSILFSGSSSYAELYFFDVGQGDSHLILLPRFGKEIKILIDGGFDARVLGELEEALSPTDRYIDIVALSHPQLDHFGGLIEVLKRYKVGAFIYNGREGAAAAWGDLKKELREKNIPAIVLGEGDSLSFRTHTLSFLSPNKAFAQSKELNDSSLVALLSSGGIKALFTGDIGKNVEEYLAANHDIDVHVLKVGHHGSKYSSTNPFLREASPNIAVIQVGKNRYGHPTKEAMSRLSYAGARIYRNDMNGTVRLILGEGYIDVKTEK